MEELCGPRSVVPLMAQRHRCAIVFFRTEFTNDMSTIHFSDV